MVRNYSLTITDTLETFLSERAKNNKIGLRQGVFAIYVLGRTRNTHRIINPPRLTGIGHDKHDSKTLHGLARFARMKDIQKASLFAQNRVVLGSFAHRILKHDGSEHLLAFAPTLSSKGANNVIPTLLDWPESAVVLDVKRELYNLTAGYRSAALGQNIFPFDPTSENSCRFNPPAEVRFGMAQAISDAQSESVAHSKVDRS